MLEQARTSRSVSGGGSGGAASTIRRRKKKNADGDEERKKEPLFLFFSLKSREASLWPSGERRACGSLGDF
jgi:hypothetical protein